ncbi:AraC family transcriptional regulator [Xanthobacter sediminis]
MMDRKFEFAARNASDPVIVAINETRRGPRDLGMHSHARGQLSALRRGLLTFGTETGAWVVPPDYAIWIPPHRPHFGYSHGSFEGWVCYIAETACTALPDHPCTMNITGLLREAVIRAAAWSEEPLNESQSRLALVILDELRAAATEPFGLPMPRDPRLLRIARALLENPGDRRGIGEWASWAAVSERTISRRFVIETGFSFTLWRQRARLMRALELLADQVPVTTIAFDLGYESVSAFVALFKRAMGVTPTAYFGKDGGSAGNHL